MEHPVPNDYLLHIGDMTVSFSLLEYSIQSFVWSLIEEKQRIGQIITAELSFRKLRALLISLYLERYGENSEYSILKGLMDRGATLESRRNQITHSMWAVGKTPQTVTRIKTTAKENSGLKFQFEDVQSKELADFVTEIKQLTADIQIFWVGLIKDGKTSTDLF
jgi:hypothetical protein